MSDQCNTIPNQPLSLKWALMLLRFVGGYSRKTTFLGYVTLTSIFLSVFFMVSDIILNFTGIESLRKISFLPSFFMSLLKTYYILTNTNQVLDLVNNLRYFWPANKFDAATEKRYEKLVRNITLICATYIILPYLIAVLLAIVPLLDFEARTLLYSDFAFCNMESLYCWIPMYIWQMCVVFFQIVPVVLAFDLLIITFCGYIMTACILLKIGLQELNTENIHQRKYILKEIVKQHDFMMTFLNSVNDMFTYFILVQFWCSLGTMILMLNMMVANGLPPKAKDVVHFGSLYVTLAFQLFVYSTLGTLIEEEVRNVSTDMYFVNWYDRNRTDLRKDLSLMIFRAQMTKVLNVGKMSDLNYTLFVDVVRNSMSVFTLIYQLANQEPKH